MGMVCTVCSHPAKQAIDNAIVQGLSQRAIAKQHDLHHSAVNRHAREHIVEELRLAHQVARGQESDSLMSTIEELLDGAVNLMEEARSAGKLTPAVMASNVAGQHWERMAKLLGRLDAGPKVSVNVWMTPEFDTLLRLLRTALAPWPAALTAVLEAIRQAGAAVNNQTLGAATELIDGEFHAQPTDGGGAQDRTLVTGSEAWP